MKPRYEKVLEAVYRPIDVYFTWTNELSESHYPAEISTRVEGKVKALTRLIRHELGVLGKPSLKRLRWTGPVFRNDGSSIYIRIFDNQITPPCDAWTKELKLRKYVISPVVTVENHQDYVVLADRSEYRIYQCSICTGSFHIAKTWMWQPVRIKL